MLHQDVLMADIDVDQWRNAQALLLRSAKSLRRLIVIHENGNVVKFRHTHGTPMQGRIANVTNPHRVARELYEANKETVDLVVVMEREAVDAYFAQIQDAWNIEADLDEFVQQTYAALDSYPEGIVTHPGPARHTLGLQWRIGTSLEEVNTAARTFVTPGTTIVLGVHDGDALWASLVLDFDQNWKITSITTADPSLVDIIGSRDEILDRLTAWVEETGKTVSLALNIDRDSAEVFLAARGLTKLHVLQRLLAEKRASSRNAPQALTTD